MKEGQHIPDSIKVMDDNVRQAVCTVYKRACDCSLLLEAGKHMHMVHIFTYSYIWLCSADELMPAGCSHPLAVIMEK